MTARDELIKTLQLNPEWEVTKLIADTILNQHAHELAEKIRNSPELRDLTDDHMRDCDAAADLIDPGVGA